MDMKPYLPIGGDKSEKIKEGDYVGDDGLWHCGKCHGALQKKIKSDFFSGTVWCICKCEVQKQEERKKREMYEEEMNRIRRLKDASMMSDKYKNASFSDYVVRKENEKALRVARKYVQDFQRMKEENIGIIFYGTVGTGKSFTAACIANALLENKVSVIMTSFVKILQDIRSIEDEGQYINTLNSSSLLIIDDLGAERDTDYALEKVYNVIDSRVRINKPLILTTNLTFDEMMRTKDIRYKRIYDRIFECCHPVEIPGPSFRIMKAAQRQEAMKQIFE